MMFAAGFGTRMKHLTQHQPKPLVKVAGTALIDHALTLAVDIEPETIVANTHYLPHLLEEHLRDGPVTTLRETPDILDTGGGLRNALPLLGSDPVFTMNTDAVWTGPNPLNCAAAAWNPDKMDGLLVCVPVANTTGYTGEGDFAMDHNGVLSRGKGVVYGGVQIIKTNKLHAVTKDAFSLKLLWDEMLAQGRLFGVLHTGGWCDVGHPAGVGLAEAMLERSHV